LLGDPGSTFLCEKLGKAGKKKKEQRRRKKERGKIKRERVSKQPSSTTERKSLTKECGWKGGDGGGLPQWEQFGKRKNEEEKEEN
jgi:hypothetical protein